MLEKAYNNITIAHGEMESNITEKWFYDPLGGIKYKQGLDLVLQKFTG